jgi:hypothetical protein
MGGFVGLHPSWLPLSMGNLGIGGSDDNSKSTMHTSGGEQSTTPATEPSTQPTTQAQ